MQSERETPLAALLSVPVILALIAMAAFYFSILVPDKAFLAGTAIQKNDLAGMELVKSARRLKPYKLMEKGQLTEAVLLISQMNPANSHDPVLVYCASVILMKGGSKKDAFAYMKRALALAPQNRDLRLEYARMLTEEGNLDEAVSQYRLIISKWPRVTGARMDLAQLLLATNKPAEAAKELQSLIEISPNDPDAHKVCGVALARSGKAQEGMEEYLKGMVTESGTGQPEAVKFILGSFGNMDKAKYELEQNAARNPDDPMPKLRLAELCLYSGQPADAKQYLIAARKLAPGNPEIHRSLCVAFKRLGDNRQAITSFMQSIVLEQEQNKKLKQKVILK